MSTSLTQSQRSLRARLAAYSQHAQGRTNTHVATAARLSRLEAKVDPDGTLHPEERARRMKLALKAQMTALALRASIARSKKKADPDRDSGPANGGHHGDGALPPAA